VSRLFCLPTSIPAGPDGLGAATAEENTVNRWDNGRYSRTIVADGHPVRLTVVQETAVVEPTLTVTVESATPISEQARKESGLLVQKMFGLDVDLRPFYELASDDPVIGLLVERFRGMRPPRFPTVFEGLIIRLPASKCPWIWESCC
jgi:DNA-3-methyladenine glycosylase II